MNRRDFLHAGAAGLALSASGVHVSGQDKKPRVGLIAGSGVHAAMDFFAAHPQRSALREASMQRRSERLDTYGTEDGNVKVES